MNKVRSRLDKALKLMMVCLMTVTCFSDFPVRVIAETFSVDSVIRIESDGSAETADPAVLNIQVVLEDQTTTETRSVASGTLSISAMEGYELDTMSLEASALTDRSRRRPKSTCWLSQRIVCMMRKAKIQNRR